MSGLSPRPHHRRCVVANMTGARPRESRTKGPGPRETPPARATCMPGRQLTANLTDQSVSSHGDPRLPTRWVSEQRPEEAECLWGPILRQGGAAAAALCLSRRPPRGRPWDPESSGSPARTAEVSTATGTHTSYVTNLPKPAPLSQIKAVRSNISFLQSGFTFKVQSANTMGFVSVF